jgi:hypothetical protein
VTRTLLRDALVLQLWLVSVAHLLPTEASRGGSDLIGCDAPWPFQAIQPGQQALLWPRHRGSCPALKAQ